MKNKLYKIIFPGLTYKATGPVWIDKLKISAMVNNKQVDVYDLSQHDAEYQVATQVTAAKQVEITNFKTFKQDDVIFIQHRQTSSIQSYMNDQKSGYGLCAVDFDGGLTDKIVFTVEIYTNCTWEQKTPNSPITVKSAECDYILLDTIKVEYNPFIVFSLAPKLVTGTLLPATSGKTFTPVVPQNLPTKISLTSAKTVNLDSGREMTTEFDNLPMVPRTKAVINKAQKDLLNGDLRRKINKNLNCSKFHLLLFRNDLPQLFGKNASSSDGYKDKLALCAYRKPVDGGSVGRQRYTIIGVTQDTLSVGIAWPQTINYDFSDFVKSVKYYSSKQFQVDLTVELNNASSFTVSQPTDLYKISNTTYTLQSGCSWQPVIKGAEDLTDDNLWDVRSEYKSLEDIVWTKGNNRGTKIPTSTSEPTGTLTLSGTYNNTITSNQLSYSGKLDFSVLLESLSNVQYLTFLDSSYSSKSFNDLIGNSAQLAHPIEKNKGTIKVAHASTTITPKGAGLTVSIDTSQVPNQCNYSIYPYVELKDSDTQGNIFSYPIVDSEAGGKQITSISALSSLEGATVTDVNGGDAAKYTPAGCWTTTQTCYILPKGKNSQLKISTGKTSGYIKYTLVPKDPSKLRVGWSPITFFSKVSTEGEAIIMTSYDSEDCIVGSIGYIDVSESELETLALSHSVGCIENTKVFDQVCQAYYFPPEDTFCVGFYRATESTTISESSVVMLYDTPTKNDIILNQLIGFQYKKALT